MHKKCKKGAVSEWEAEIRDVLFFCLSRALFFRHLVVFVVNICKNLRFQSGLAVVYLFVWRFLAFSFLIFGPFAREIKAFFAPPKESSCCRLVPAGPRPALPGATLENMCFLAALVGASTWPTGKRRNTQKQSFFCDFCPADSFFWALVPCTSWPKTAKNIGFLCLFDEATGPMLGPHTGVFKNVF